MSLACAIEIQESPKREAAAAFSGTPDLSALWAGPITAGAAKADKSHAKTPLQTTCFVT
jgi:hypothetical protein